MNRNPDPCYCEQAQAYEDLLNRTLETVVKFKAEMQGPSGAGENKFFNSLILDIETTIGNYQQAQSEYSDDFDDSGWDK